MPIGTSDGQTYDNEWEYMLAAAPSRMPLGSPEMPTDASNSQEGSSDTPVDYLHHLGEKLKETWPVKAAEGFIDALKLPGQVYNGEIDPMSDEGIGRAAEFALAFGTGGLESEGKGSFKALGHTVKDIFTSPLDTNKIKVTSQLAQNTL